MNFKIKSLRELFTGKPQAAPVPAPVEYTRPSPDEDMLQSIDKYAAGFTNNKSMAQIRQSILLLCIENSRLLLEVNEHRKALGIEPLPVYKPR